MNKYIVSILAFTAGAAAGIFATKGYFEKMYAQIAQEEIDSVKAVYAEKKEKPTVEEKKDEKKLSVTDKTSFIHHATDPEKRQNYHDRIRKMGYTSQDEPDDSPNDMDPYVIMPEEFDTIDDYDSATLTYYADHVLTDEDDHVMSEDEIESTVGSESLTHFGEYENDSVFVRNEHREMDYEITMDPRTYDQAMR